jgi:hypothetical protein
LLHQAIKGAFKDHLVTWVVDYLGITQTESQANKILDDIDYRCVTDFFPYWHQAHTPRKNRCRTTIPGSSPLSSRSPLQAVDRG